MSGVGEVVNLLLWWADSRCGRLFAVACGAGAVAAYGVHQWRREWKAAGL